LRKIVRIFAGIALLFIGFILSLPFVPGPGVAIMVLGLVLLSEHCPWARRVVDWGKAKLEGVTSGRNKPPAAKSLTEQR
jgi:hypothetical protein